MTIYHISQAQIQRVLHLARQMDGELTDMLSVTSLPDVPLPSASGFVWPSSYQPAWITQFYRANPQNYLKFGLDGHEGLDIRTGLGRNCICIFDGLVSRVDAWPNTGNYGYSIRVSHPTTGHTSIYAHLNPSQSVPPVGVSVKAGQVLGLCDSTGNSSAAHLHISIKNSAGEFIDPLSLLTDAYRVAGGAQDLPPIGAPMVVKK